MFFFRYISDGMYRIGREAEEVTQRLLDSKAAHVMKTLLGKSGRRGLAPGHHVEAVRRS